jgi:WD40 repeat protein
MTSTEGKQVIGRQIKYHNGYVYGYWGKFNFIERYTSDKLEVAGRYDTNNQDTRLYFIDFSDQFLFAAGHPGIIFQWDLKTRELVNSYKIPKKEDLDINAIKVYKNFLFINSEIPGESGRVDVWDFTTNTKIRTIKYEPQGETTIEVTNNILYVMSGTECQMFDESGEEVDKVEFEDDEVYIQPIPNGSDTDTVYFCMNNPQITIISFHYASSSMKSAYVRFKGRVLKIFENRAYFCLRNTLYISSLQYDDEGEEVKKIVEMEEDIDTFVIGDNKIFIKQDETIHTIPLPNFVSKYEEDSDSFTSYHTDSESIPEGNEGDVSKCLDQNLIMLEPYSAEDNPFLIYLPNSKGKFGSPNCTTKEELEQYFKTFIGNTVPDNIMTIYTTPAFPTETGHGSEPTGKIVVKLPMNNIYVTLGSIIRVMSSNNQSWYAQKLFSGMRRRVGNLKGLFAASMNHGQVPGFYIYKLFTKEEILQGVEVKEDNDD